MKNMALLIDINVLLDWILLRQPFHENATKIIKMCMDGKAIGFIAAHTVLNVLYILRKDFNASKRQRLGRFLCTKFEVIGINGVTMLEALDFPDFRDLEDNLQMQCAIEENVDYIITRDIKDFQNSKVKALLPEEFLAIKEKNL